jgi:sigma-B regulation protein RsbU (phosphoserine phosphatase)
MTLFCCEIDTCSRSLRWVRAGHDPAIFYDPDTNTFEELKGPGLALGVDADRQYDEQQKTELQNRQIIVIGTDGIWEAHNSEGDTFGKESLLEIIRQHASAGAQEIVSAILSGVNRFRKDVITEDDVTLVVIKVTG